MAISTLDYNYFETDVDGYFIVGTMLLLLLLLLQRFAEFFSATQKMKSDHASAPYCSRDRFISSSIMMPNIKSFDLMASHGINIIIVNYSAIAEQHACTIYHRCIRYYSDMHGAADIRLLSSCFSES